MGRKSRIDRELPADVRAELDALIAEERCTIDELVAWLGEKGFDMPRSNVARHVLSKEEVIAKIRESRDLVQAIGLQLGPDDGDGSRNAQLMEMLHVLIHGGMMRLITDPEAEVSPGDLAKLAKTLQSANSAQKSDVDRRINEAKLSAARAAAKATAEKALAAVDKIAAEDPKASKLETLKRIREEIYGIVA